MLRRKLTSNLYPPLTTPASEFDSLATSIHLAMHSAAAAADRHFMSVAAEEISMSSRPFREL
jgi:hypothetical protein